MHETLLIKQGFSAHLFRNFKRSLNYANMEISKEIPLNYQ